MLRASHRAPHATVPQRQGPGPAAPFNAQLKIQYITKFYLADAAGNPLSTDCGYCTPGTSVDAYIWVEIYNNAAASRKAIILLGDIYANGVKIATTCPQGQCILDAIDGKASKNVPFYHFTWTCGQEVRVNNIILSWETAQQYRMQQRR